MEEEVRYCMDSQTVLLTDEQFKTYPLTQDSKFVTVSREEITGLSLANSSQKDAVSLPGQNMQETFVEPAPVSVFQPVVVTDVYQTLSTGLLVGNPALISVPVTQSYMIATSQKEPAKAVAVPSNESSQPRPRMKVSKGTALTLKVCTADGFLTSVKISEAMEQELDLNSLVHEAITQVYSINMDLDAILEEEIINSEEIQPAGRTAKELMEIDSESIPQPKIETPERLQASTPVPSPAPSNRYFEVADQGIQPQEQDIEMTEQEVIEEGVVMSSGSETYDVIAGEPPKMLICRFCHFASPDPYMCQRCRRTFKSQTPSSISSKETASSESESTSPSKSDKERRHESKRRRCPRKCKKEERRKQAHKVENETVSLLSSDEEDTKSLQNGSSHHPLTDVFSKEPVITADTESTPHDSLRGGGLELESLLDSPDIEKIRLDCRSVRFGSYKVKPQDTIVLTEHGVRLKVPSLSKSSTIIKILMKDIVKVLIHFGKSGQFSSMAAPTFFYYITHEASKKIREALHMSAKNKDFYFDPTSKEEQHKRITLLPENVSVQDRLFIKSIYESRCLMEELSWNEANDILVRAAPKDVQHNLKKDATATRPLQPAANSTDNIQQIMIYPPPPFKGGISINTEDYGCLREDQFLNDVIIDFYLKYLWLNVFTEEEKRRTHIFSSFFYKRLTMMSPRQHGFNAKDNLTPAEKRHMRVKGWTKSVDIFDKDFIIIPINEKSHWFLGIICFPGLSGPVRMADGLPVPNLCRKKGETSVLAGGQAPAKIWGTTISLVKQPGDTRSSSSQSRSTIHIEPDEDRGDESERDEADADDDEMEPDTTDEESNKEDDLLDEATPRISKVKPNLEAIKQPCILIFDSLAVQSRAKVVATLREYLQIEWKVRHKGKPKDFSKDVFKGAVPKVPQQPNFVDCGLYLLQFVEAFFKNPITDYRMPIRSIKEWFTAEVVSRKRYNIMKLLHELMRDQNIDTTQLNLPSLELNPFGDYEGGEEEEDGLGEGMEFGDEAGEEEEAMPEDEEEEEDEDEDGDESAFAAAALEGALKVNPPKRFGEQGQGREVSRTVELRLQEKGETTPSTRRFDSPSTRSFDSPSTRSFDSPSPRLDPRGELSLRPEVRAEPVRNTEQPTTPRPRLPDSVTICEANSKRKLPLSLKDIRNTRLSSSQTIIEKVKKPRSND